MTDWLKRMIERCTKRRADGVCDTCHLRRVCIHGGRPVGATATAPPSERDNPLALLFDAFSRLAERRSTPTLRRSVEAEIERQLEGGTVSVESVASALALTRATLYRRLKAEGCSYEQALDAVRVRLARRYLTREGRSVKDTAYRLGFSDPAAFSRAFKRWTGEVPSALRA